HGTSQRLAERDDACSRERQAVVGRLDVTVDARLARRAPASPVASVVVGGTPSPRAASACRPAARPAMLPALPWDQTSVGAPSGAAAFPADTTSTIPLLTMVLAFARMVGSRPGSPMVPMAAALPRSAPR